MTQAIRLVLVGAVALACVQAGAQKKYPDKTAYLGETHVHTSWSPDAWLFGNQITGPAKAYKYAKGETINIRWATDRAHGGALR